MLDKAKLLEAMTRRKNELYNQITRDFGGGLAGREYEHMEVKYWKEAIERGEFDINTNNDNTGGSINEKCTGEIQTVR